MGGLCCEQGARYGSLIVVSRHGTNKHGRAIWLCKCDCGNQTTTTGSLLRNGHKKSCGCLKIKHNLSRTPTYETWRAMKKRCYNNKHKAYKNYGGRGITICDRWRDSFKTFVDDMGVRPDGMSIDRIDSNKGYYADNCIWSNDYVQNRNRRSNKMNMMAAKVARYYQGKGYSCARIARAFNLSAGTIEKTVRGELWAEGKT